MQPADTLCIHCGYHKHLKRRLKTTVTEPLMREPPQGYRVEDRGDCLVITRNPAVKVSFLGAIAGLAAGLAVSAIAWSFHPLAAGIVLGLFLLVFLTAIYRVVILVDHQWIVVRHEPFFWPPKTIRTGDVQQLYCRRRGHWSRRSQKVYYTYDVCVLTERGGRRRLLSHLPAEGHALFFEERIEHFLGITDREVEESITERYGWLIRFAILLAVSIAILIYSIVNR